MIGFGIWSVKTAIFEKMTPSGQHEASVDEPKRPTGHQNSHTHEREREREKPSLACGTHKGRERKRVRAEEEESRGERKSQSRTKLRSLQGFHGGELNGLRSPVLTIGTWLETDSICGKHPTF